MSIVSVKSFNIYYSRLNNFRFGSKRQASRTAGSLEETPTSRLGDGDVFAKYADKKRKKSE
jgi:hypothetical protein